MIPDASARQGNSGTYRKNSKTRKVVKWKRERDMMCNVRHKFGKLGLQSGNIICSKVLLDNWAWLIWSIQCGVVGFHNEWMNGAESDVTSAGDWVALVRVLLCLTLPS